MKSFTFLWIEISIKIKFSSSTGWLWSSLWNFDHKEQIRFAKKYDSHFSDIWSCTIGGDLERVECWGFQRQGGDKPIKYVSKTSSERWRSQFLKFKRNFFWCTLLTVTKSDVFNSKYLFMEDEHNSHSRSRPKLMARKIYISPGRVYQCVAVPNYLWKALLWSFYHHEGLCECFYSLF